MRTSSSPFNKDADHSTLAKKGQEKNYSSAIDSIHIARACVHLGDLHETKGELEKAVLAFNTSISHFESAIDTSPNSDKEVAGASQDVGVSLEEQNDRRLEILFVLARLGGIYRRQGKISDALDAYQLLRKRGEKDFGVQHPMVRLAKISTEMTRGYV